MKLTLIRLNPKKNAGYVFLQKQDNYVYVSVLLMY